MHLQVGHVSFSAGLGLCFECFALLAADFEGLLLSLAIVMLLALSSGVGSKKNVVKFLRLSRGFTNNHLFKLTILMVTYSS